MKKNKTKRTISPVITISVLIFFVMVISSIMSILNIEGSKAIFENGVLETSIVVVNNIFSKEGIIHFFNNIIVNFQLLQPLVLIVLSLLAVGIGTKSGLFNHLFSPLKKLKLSWLTFIVVMISIISSFIGEYSYIILLPLVAVLYKYSDHSPVLGIITVFLGIGLGYGTGIFYNYDDYVLGVLTQNAAVIDVDQSYRFTLLSNIYIMLASTIILGVFLTFAINKYISPKLTEKEENEELIVSKKALTISLISLVAMIAIILTAIFTGLFLDNGQGMFISKLFSSNSPFNSSLIYLYLIVLTVAGGLYGFISKNFKNNHDFGKSFVEQFDKIGYLFLLLFLTSTLIGIVDWTNLGVVVTTKLLDVLITLNFSGIPLIIISFIFIILMSILIPSSNGKWLLISPLLIPLFMRANMSPDFAQFIFKTADGIGKTLTVFFVFFAIMLGLVGKYTNQELSVFKTLKLMIPVILLSACLWLLILVSWYIVGLPLGVGASITM